MSRLVFNALVGLLIAWAIGSAGFFIAGSAFAGSVGAMLSSVNPSVGGWLMFIIVFGGPWLILAAFGLRAIVKRPV